MSSGKPSGSRHTAGETGCSIDGRRDSTVVHRDQVGGSGLLTKCRGQLSREEAKDQGVATVDAAAGKRQCADRSIPRRFREAARSEGTIMSLFDRINRPDTQADPEASFARARSLASGPLGRFARAGALLAVCGAGLLGTAGTASAMSSSPWNQPPAGQVVTLNNVGTGFVADDPNLSTSPGTQIIQWSANDGDNQSWDLYQDSNGHYVIKNRYSGLCLDDANQSTQAGNPIIQWTCNGQSNQEWDETTNNSGQIQFQNVFSSQDLSPSSSDAAAGLVQEPVSYSSNQLWTTAQHNYSLLSQAISVPQAGVGTDDPNTYTCQQGYHFEPIDSNNQIYMYHQQEYHVYGIAEGQIPYGGGDDYNYSLATTDDHNNGFGAPYPNNAMTLEVGYYHLSGGTKTGQTMFRCFPNTDGTYGTDETDIVFGQAT
jgi:Ricin-type beta-trefoil lectin domain-like